MAPISLAIIGSVYREGHRKNIAFSIYAAGAPAGFAIGAVFSALLAQLAFWPWAYYLAAIICCVFTVLTFVSVPDLEHGTDVDPAQRPKGIQTFDWLGAFTGVSGLILFNVAWNRAPAVGWQSAQAIAPLIIGIALFVAFLFAEKRARQPLLPISQISTDAAWVLLIVALGWASFGVLVFYLATFLLEIQQNTMLIVAAKYCPVPVTGLIASLLASILMKKGVRTAWLLAIALLWFCVPSVLVATAPVDQLYWRQIFWAFLLCPFGMDISFPTATVMVSNLVAKQHQGIAASLVATVVYYSQSIGLGIAGTVEVNVSHGDALAGMRGAQYSGIGLSLLGFIVAIAYALSGSSLLRRVSTQAETPQRASSRTMSEEAPESQAGNVEKPI